MTNYNRLKIEFLTNDLKPHFNLLFFVSLIYFLSIQRRAILGTSVMEGFMRHISGTTVPGWMSQNS